MAQIASGQNLSRKAITTAFILVLAAASLSGCTDPETRSQIDDAARNSRAGLDNITSTNVAAPPKRYNPLVVSDKVWMGNTALHMQRGIPLPAKFEAVRGVAIVSTEPMTIGEIMREVQRQTGLIVHVPEALLRGSSGGRSAVAPMIPSPVVGAPGAPGAGGASAGSADSKMASAMPIAYEGPLSGLLERVTGYFGYNWRFDGSVIEISNFETRVFTVEALPGSQQVQDGMQDDTSGGSSGGGSSGGSGGGSGGSSSQNSITQNSKFSIDIKYWEELEKVVTNMLGGVGSVVVSPSLGTVTVTTNPRTMQVIAQYLEQENQRISRQIAVNVEIYSVSLSKGVDFNLAFNTALHRLADFSGNFSGASAPTTISGFTGGGALSLAILNHDTHQPQVSDVFKALSGIGDTTKVAKFPLITLNNRPVSRRVGKDVTYVASATTNTTGSGSSSTFAGTALTPGVVHQGFSVQLTPRILDDGRILLQYSLSIVDVLSIDSFNSVTGPNSSNAATAAGSSTIELPTTSNRIFVQQSVLKSGSTLFLGGAEENDASQNSQGVGDPSNYWLGGGISSGVQHTMVFFAITPQVLDVPHSEQE